MTTYETDAEYEARMIAEATAETEARQAKRDAEELAKLEAREVELAAEWVEVDQRLTRAEETLVMYAKRGVGGQALEGRALEVRRLADELAGLTKLMTSTRQALHIRRAGGDPVAFGLSPAEAYLQRTLTPEYRQSAFERAVSTVVTANHDLQRSVNAMYAERMGR